eukprot:ANDGO_03884.mRNA.1 hypothetical protein
MASNTSPVSGYSSHGGGNELEQLALLVKNTTDVMSYSEIAGLVDRHLTSSDANTIELVLYSLSMIRWTESEPHSAIRRILDLALDGVKSPSVQTALYSSTVLANLAEKNAYRQMLIQDNAHLKCFSVLRVTEYREIEDQCMRAISEFTKLSACHESLLARGVWNVVMDYLAERDALFQRYATRSLYNLARGSKDLLLSTLTNPLRDTSKSKDEWIASLSLQILDIMVPKVSYDELSSMVRLLGDEKDQLMRQIAEQRDDIAKLIKSSEMWQRSYELAQEKLGVFSSKADEGRKEAVKSEQESVKKWRERTSELEEQIAALKRTIADQKTDVGKAIESSEIWQSKYENLRKLLDSVTIRPPPDTGALSLLIRQSGDRRVERVSLMARLREALTDVVNVLDAGVRGHQSLDLTYVCDASKILLQKLIYDIEQETSTTALAQTLS